MSETVVPGRAARELGLRPREFELGMQLGEVPTVPGPEGWGRRVPRAALDALKKAEDFPGGLRERLRVVTTVEGAALLEITTGRFGRLARAGCFTPVRFHMNRYRAVVWLYLASELRRFGERRPELLTGQLPPALRTAVDGGADRRPRDWRARRVTQLAGQATSPWERAAARAAVLDEDVLAEAVPDPVERARLAALRPELVSVRSESAAMCEAVKELSTAFDDDEVLRHRLLLAADLEEARRQDEAGEARPRPVAESGAGGRADAPAGGSAESHPEPGSVVGPVDAGRRPTRLRRLLARASGTGRRGPVSRPVS
ncbi:DUF6397 family protein [Streptomyces armeniacus]|nr:DUF6397 family protein [Streptomyces armeniacus]